MPNATCHTPHIFVQLRIGRGALESCFKKWESRDEITTGNAVSLNRLTTS